MAARVAGNIENLRDLAAEGIGLAFAQRHVDAGNALAIGLGADDGGAGRLLEGEIAAGVIVVVMGVEDMRERPAQRIELRFDRGCLGRIDHSDRTALRFAQQPDVIVPEAELVMDLEGHGSRFSRVRRVGEGGWFPRGNQLSPLGPRWKSRHPCPMCCCERSSQQGTTDEHRSFGQDGAGHRLVPGYRLCDRRRPRRHGGARDRQQPQAGKRQGGGGTAARRRRPRRRSRALRPMSRRRPAPRRWSKRCRRSTSW